MRKLSDCWSTPDWLFSKLDEEFNFNIDLCATKNNTKCSRFYIDYLNDEMDHTSQHLTKLFLKLSSASWVKTAFMNPPYSYPLPFVEKAWEDSKHCKIVCLLKVDTSTRWWSVFWDYEKHQPKPGCEVRFFPKRIKFTAPEGVNQGSGPAFPSCLVIMDRRCLV